MKHVNGIANLLVLLGLVGLTICGLASVIEQAWPWWAKGIWISFGAIGWGVVLSWAASEIYRKRST